MSALAIVFLAAQLVAPVDASMTATATTAAATATATVDILLFSDFQCPFCAQLSGPIRELQRTPPAGFDVRVRFMHFPLGIHPNAPLAHQAALAAAEQHKFWEMHDLLFANRSHAQRADVVGYAAQLGLDLEQFQNDLDSDRIKAAIERDQAEGKRRGVDATPTFYVNGKEYVGARSLAQLRQIVEGDVLRTRALTEIPDTSLSRGPADAPVTIEVFADLQSPVTKPALAVVDAVVARHPHDVRVQFRNMPLVFHRNAEAVHEAAMSAARQGRFWEFAGSLLDHPDTADEPALVALARRLGLDEPRFAEALHDHRFAPRVAVDVEDAERRGVRGSPAIVVNGRRFDGVPSLSALTGSVDAALATPPSKRP